jgi:hypothetical protein
VTVRRSNIRGARAFCSLTSACCRRFEARLATSAFESLGSVMQRCSTTLSGNMPDVAGIMPALTDPSVCNA